jgi:acetyl-CoA acetyltransferase
MQLEDLGFADKGAGAALAARRDLTCTGDLPLNTSGGQLSTGQAGAAGGFLGVVEALRQVTNQPLGAAVPNATLALVSGYGTVTYDRGLCSAAAILRRGRVA